MKPTTIEVNELRTLHQNLHPGKLNQLEERAKKFTQFLSALAGFRIVEYGLPTPHIGRVIVDGVLQQGKDYEKLVRPAVTSIIKFREAATLRGFTGLLNKKPLKEILGNFGKDNTKQDLLNTADYFIKRGLNTFSDLWEWLKSENNRDSFAGAGKLGPFFRPADKTADYFRKLVGHWDAVAVDRGQKLLLAQAQVAKRYSTLVNYKERRTILQLTALNIGCRPIDLDESIYLYYVNTNKMADMAQTLHQRNESKYKYCHSCGYKLSPRDGYCARCGAKQH